MSTREQVLEKIACLEVQAHAAIVQRVTHLLDAGAVDLTDFDNNYALPKILYAEALRDLAESYAPNRRDLCDLARNLRNF